LCGIKKQKHKKTEPMHLPFSFTKTLACLSVPALLIFSCKKGDTGPAGPAGTANVIYSSWFTPNAYTKDTVFGVWGFNYNKAAADITQQVLDSGTVITYGRLLGYNALVWPATQVAQLPISLTYVQGSTMTDTWSALATAGILRIRFVNDKNYWTSISTAHQFRYLIIPGGQKSTATTSVRGVVSGTGRQLSGAEISDIAQNYRKMSYAEVCQRLGVPE
jgi:hypothetical protein